MDLEGFGTSLLGRVLFIAASASDVWLPSEFLSGPFTYTLLITGPNPRLRRLEADYLWSAVLRPTTAKEWSCIATLIRAMGGSLLLVFDVEAPPASEAFVSFLESVVAEGRTTLTRVWCGVGTRIPAIPDAIFFPLLRTMEHRQEAYELLKRLPGRAEHGPWTPLPFEDWTSLLDATIASGYGLLMSDVGEVRWTLFWHRIEDSLEGGHEDRFQKGLSWIQTGTRLLELERKTS